MIATPFPRRVLLMSAAVTPTLELFAQPPLDGCSLVTADSSTQAALLLQSSPGDVVVADDSHYRQEGLDGIRWLAERHAVPIVLLADIGPEKVNAAYESGISLWLPRRFVLGHPCLLAHALKRAWRWSDLLGRYQRTRLCLDQAQRQVDRLVTMLWRSGALEVEKRWYTHRHMMERLSEEVARARRHGTPLTVAIGETRPRDDTTPQPSAELMDWTAAQVAVQKRRSDIAGHYGLKAFMLLLTHTPARGGEICCRRLQHHLEHASRTGAPHGPVRTYFGLAAYSAEADTAQKILRHAEERLEAARHATQEPIIAG